MNKDTNKLFQGILQYTSEQFEQIEKKSGVIYLVRKSDQTNEGDAEVWFGSRRYATTNVSELLTRNVGASDTVDTLDEVPTDVFLKYVAQFLTEEQQEQVRKNINAVKNVEGKQLSTEDFTTTLKSKLDSLENYDDTEIRETLNEITDNVDTSFNELNNNLESTFSAINSDMETLRNSKQDNINDLDAIREGAALGATALQSYTEQYKGTVTGVKMNGAITSQVNGVVDLGTVITSHQDISGKQDTLVSGTNIKTINGEDILGGGDLIIDTGYVDASVTTRDTAETLDEINVNKCIKYVAQYLTEEEKEQACVNINAMKYGNISCGTF